MSRPVRLVRGSAWCVVFAALAAPAGAATPQILAHGTAAPTGSPVVRTAANGDLMVLWSDGTRVRAAFRLNGGPFFRAHAVPGVRSLDARRGGGRPLLTTSGNAIVAWPAEKRMLIATAARGGRFAVPQAAPLPRPSTGSRSAPTATARSSMPQACRACPWRWASPTAGGEDPSA
jgi:hypothetical protein